MSVEAASAEDFAESHHFYFGMTIKTVREQTEGVSDVSC